MPKTDSERLEQSRVLIVAGLIEEADVMAGVLTSASYRQGRGVSGLSLKHSVFLSKPISKGERQLACAVVTPTGMGKLEAAVATTEAVICFQPRFVFLVGIAGAFRHGPRASSSKAMHLGDVLVARYIYDFDMRKISADGNVGLRSRTMQTDPHLLEVAAHVSGTAWHSNIPMHVRRGMKPQVHFGALVSGDAVVASENFFERAREIERDFILEQSKSPIGVEMEGVGVALAVQRIRPGAGFLLVKGISDFADSHKHSDELAGRTLAKYGAAGFVVSMMGSDRFKKLSQGWAR